jgi:hypothetical protein
MGASGNLSLRTSEEGICITLALELLESALVTAVEVCGQPDGLP